MSKSQSQNKPAPDIPTQDTDGDTRIDYHNEGGGLGVQTPDRSSVSKEIAESKEERGRVLASISPKWRKLFARAWNGSRKAAIRSHCLECSGFSPQVVRQCNNSACALFEFRRKG